MPYTDLRLSNLFLVILHLLNMKLTGKRKAKLGFHKIEQDRAEGTVYSEPAGLQAGTGGRKPAQCK
jgi:hypothetical protein